ncbi:CoA-binding protein [Clostridium algidicarnis]|uniref:CoA-binding protein n=2 Tax=Clostridium algidicarnis TaxID=37659 RepID=A0ABS6C4N1_9CLOT|nr:CoA-binding protein [Clostridium algidicarnis]MBB6629965.1 CoA-binding protein [Clostridium algidicarnis]MBB6697020.1 CoA-binding protein [Clostridium algidicarnis]MBU3193372.1 CoA-binding protein [Clostridium algidicarnis]MBU3197257.1 CoA-binding protein [Clostridium algidicarnis]MBU3204725.1 CoA-binding protein [Clostridium algidicarnis]
MEAKDFMKYKNWVVVGDVLNDGKYANKILKKLKENDYNVEGVTYKSEMDGAYKTLKEVTYTIGVLDLCINPIKGIDIVKEAHEMGIKNILIQPGAESDEIIDFCNQNDIIAIKGCALVELSKME